MIRNLLVLLIMAMFPLSNIFSQNITFSGKNAKTNASVSIDSIRIFNLTIGKDTLLKKTNIFDLNSLVLGVDDKEVSYNFNVISKNNIIDDLNNSIKFEISLEIESNIKILVVNNLGQVFIDYSSYLSLGNHSYSFVSNELIPGVYFIVVKNGSNSKAIKFVNLLSGLQNIGTINYDSFQENRKMVIKPGDEFNFTAYSNGFEPDNLNNKTANGGENFEFSFQPKDNAKFNKYCLIPLLYQHIKDSDGSKFYDNTDCVFAFEPNDSLHLYIGSDTDAVSVSGKYSISNSKVNFVITGDYFPLNITATIDTSLDQITLPFNVLSAKNGNSIWKKVRLKPNLYMQVLFKMIAIDETVKPNETVTQRVVDWANSVKDNNPQNDIEVISLKEPNIKIIYKGGSTEKIILYQKNIIKPPVSLTTGSLASDPRTHLNVAKPKISDYDPLEKTSLFIGPWDGISFPTLTKNKDGQWAPNYEKMSSMIGRFDKLDDMAKSMTDIGYSAKVIRNADAGLIGLIENLLPGNGRAVSPGFIYFSTHGNEDGELSTGDFLYSEKDVNDLITELNTKYPDFLSYAGGVKDFYKVLTFYETVYGWRVNKPIKNILIRPMFWKWLKEKGANFSRSLVHLSACDVGNSTELIDNISARSIFVYQHTVPEDFSAAVERYLIKTLSRPSHSAEEAFYNIKRIILNKQMILTEDNIFNGIPLPTNKNDNYAPVAWYFDGSENSLYSTSGWLNSENINGGDVWYLLWASRWSQNVDKGWQALIDCWNSCWSQGKTGGLANPGCENMSPGKAPFANEVAYTGFLLKGEYAIPPTGKINNVPRFTLKDGE
jgi:hypothetical protein